MSVLIQGDYDVGVSIHPGSFDSEGRRRRHSINLFLPSAFKGVRWLPRVTAELIELLRHADGPVGGFPNSPKSSRSDLRVQISSLYMEGVVVPDPPAGRFKRVIKMKWDGGKLRAPMPAWLLEPDWTPDPNIDNPRHLHLNAKRSGSLRAVGRRMRQETASNPSGPDPAPEPKQSDDTASRLQQARELRSFAREEAARLGMRWFINDAGELDARVVSEVSIDD